MIWNLCKLAWRNIWRSRRRTFITGSAIGLGLAAMILYMGMQGGMNRYMHRVATRSQLGDAQIHAAGFRETRETVLVIPDGAALLAECRAMPGLTAASPRLLVQGLVAIGDRSAGVEIIGIDFASEPDITDWQERLLEGVYPSAPNEVLIGRDLAEKLELAAGGKLVLTLAEEGTGELRSLLLRVAGVFYTGNPMLDKRSAFMNIAALGETMGLVDEMHEIALRFDLPDLTDAEAGALIAPLAGPGLDVAHWKKLAPALASIMSMQQFYFSITVLIVFAIIALGIVNTLTMSLAERTWEFGVLRALGSSPGRLAGLIFAEAASLGFVGAIMGSAVGLILHAVFGTWGFSLGHFQVAGVVFESKMYTILKPLPVLTLALVFVALTTLVAVSPAIRAARIRPADALRHI
jgi:ABC-type lipoprotein release transport system permease subunit